MRITIVFALLLSACSWDSDLCTGSGSDLPGCRRPTVEDVASSCVRQCEERGATDCEPECTEWATVYSDCLQEAFALAECMPEVDSGECDDKRKELYSCACENDGRTDCL